MNNKCRITIIALIAAACALSSSGIAASPQYTKAALWYVGLQPSNAAPRKASDVKATKMLHLETMNTTRIENIVESLKTKSLRCRGDKKPGDIWLVVELTTKDGDKKTYVADAERLFSEDGTCSRKINNAFRKRFNFLSECFAHCRGPSLMSRGKRR